MREVRRISIVIVAAAFGAPALALAACTFGLDVDSLSGGCRGECLDASSDAAHDATADTSAGDVVTDASSDAGDARADGPCMSTRGPSMIVVRLEAGIIQCIDRTEVTNEQYAGFLEAGAPNATSIAPCVGVGLVPQANWPYTTGQKNWPVANVTWCAADAFCAWSGKALCGVKGGGQLDVAHVGDPKLDAWYAVCSHEGKTAYPYGDAYAPGTCNGVDNVPIGPLPVGTFTSCTTDSNADAGVVDLSGNVWEWIDACGLGDRCAAHGGAFNSTPDEMSCAYAPLYVQRDAGQATLGFRCCSP